MKRTRFVNLTLQTKTALYFIVGLLGVTLSCLFITRYFFVVAINDLENSELRQSSDQARSVITKMANDLEEHSYDWSYWDETHQLLQGEDPEAFRERNLSQDGLDALTLDLMVFSDLHGNVIESIVRDGHDLEGQLVSLVTKNEFIQRHIVSMNRVLDAARDSYSGLLLVGGQIWNLSITPVRDSEGYSGSSGWLLWGQNLTQRFPGDFRSILIADNEIVPFNEAVALDSKETNALQVTPRLIEKNQQTMTETVSLRGMTGKKVATLRTTISRAYFNKANVIFYYLLATLAVVTILISLMTFQIFRRHVALRFSDLQRDLNALLESYKFGGLTQSSKDELDTLTNLVQALATNNSQTHERLQDTQRKFEALYHSKNIAMVLVRGREIIDTNQTALSLLEYQHNDLRV